MCRIIVFNLEKSLIGCATDRLALQLCSVCVCSVGADLAGLKRGHVLKTLHNFTAAESGGGWVGGQRTLWRVCHP